VQKPEQISLYFLNNLKNIRYFVEISEVHLKEELIRYSESDMETNASEFCDRYQFRTDLDTHFQTDFPQYQKQSHLLMLVSFFEDYLNQLCHSICFERALTCDLKDIAGSGIERAKKYLKKVACVQIPTDTKYWNKIIEARDIRNIVAHNAGHLNEEAHKKHFQIIEINSHLDSEEFARVHLNIKQDYLFEVITAMENLVEAVWKIMK